MFMIFTLRYNERGIKDKTNTKSWCLNILISISVGNPPHVLFGQIKWISTSDIFEQIVCPTLNFYNGYI
jgi:hypothetical protein